MKKYLKKEQLPLYIVGIISLVVVGFVVNYTYSFFAVNKTNNNVIAGEAESMSIDLKVEKKAPNNDNKLVPQLDEYITSAVKGVNGSCVDGNNNNVCQVYKITVKNGGSTTTQLNGEVVLDAKNNPNLKWAVISGEASWTKPTLKSNVYSHTHKVLTTKEEYTGGQTKEYYIVVWISETGLDQTDTGKFTGVVNFANVNAGGGSWETTSIDNSGANAPAYTEGLIPVMYDESRGTWVKADTTSSESEYGWYDYDNKKWANAVLVKDSGYEPALKETNKSVNIVNNSIISYRGEVYDYYEFGENTATFTFATGPSGGELSFDYEIISWEGDANLTIRLNNEIIVDDYSDIYVPVYMEEEEYYDYYYYTYKRVTKTLDPNMEYTMVVTLERDGVSFIYDILLPNDLTSELNFTTNESSEESPLYWVDDYDNKIKSFDSYEILENGKFMLKEDEFNSVDDLTTVPRNFDESIIGRYICSDGVSVECDTIYQIKAISGNAITSVDSYTASMKEITREYLKNAEVGIEIPEDMMLAHYVWVPRFKYRVWNKDKIIGTDAYNAKTTGIDIVFEEGASTTGDVECTYDFSKRVTNTIRNEECSGTNGESYYTHPAFTFGEDELTGFWIGKYEISTGNGALIKAGLRSNRDDFGTINDMHLLAKSMQDSNNIFGLSSDDSIVDSHIITNMEWGAIAYLTHSKYGMCEGTSCSLIEMNYTNNEGEFIRTGSGGANTDNMYGIYDLAGGGFEVVMGNVSSSEGVYELNSNESEFQYNNNISKYITTYAYGESAEDQTAFNRTRLGDAVGEVSSWTLGIDDYAMLSISNDYSWIKRSGYGPMEEVSVFFVSENSGYIGYDATSRFVLTVF